jgi:hypothetical protein
MISGPRRLPTSPKKAFLTIPEMRHNTTYSKASLRSYEDQVLEFLTKALASNPDAASAMASK